jgi:hypothetical protein
MVFRVVQRRTMSHPHIGIAAATTDTFILFENLVRRNRLLLPGLSNAASDAVQARSLPYDPPRHIPDADGSLEMRAGKN